MTNQPKETAFNGIMDFLSEEGQQIFNAIKKYCKEKSIWQEEDHYELSVLANSFSIYFHCARICRREGFVMTFERQPGEHNGKKKGGGGIFSMQRPEYTIMKNEYQNILKHTGKFGLNPADRERLFKDGLKPRKKRTFDLKSKQ